MTPCVAVSTASASRPTTCVCPGRQNPNCNQQQRAGSQQAQQLLERPQLVEEQEHVVLLSLSNSGQLLQSSGRAARTVPAAVVKGYKQQQQQKVQEQSSRYVQCLRERSGSSLSCRLGTWPSLLHSVCQAMANSSCIASALVVQCCQLMSLLTILCIRAAAACVCKAGAYLPLLVLVTGGNGAQP